MKYIANVKKLIEDYKRSELIKSIAVGLIFFLLILGLIVVLTVNISFLYVRYVTQFIVIASLLASGASFIGVKLVYITLLNYNNEPTTNLKYIRKIELIITPIVVFILGLLPLLFI